ncbi:HypC/HybG/HupF family hydrogenase formation chaperone [candidate division WOR-3 bacterium]|nr:HypC/HybG/HupF family hydrogenase formation chaperone [candidate division WOR-3 bacterium]
MCLAVPMKLVEIGDDTGIAELGGVKREVNLGLLEGINIGDYIIVHAGFAIQKLDKKEAEETLDLLRELTNEIL